MTSTSRLKWCERQTRWPCRFSQKSSLLCFVSLKTRTNCVAWQSVDSPRTVSDPQGPPKGLYLLRGTPHASHFTVTPWLWVPPHAILTDKFAHSEVQRWDNPCGWCPVDMSEPSTPVWICTVTLLPTSWPLPTTYARRLLIMSLIKYPYNDEHETINRFLIVWTIRILPITIVKWLKRFYVENNLSTSLLQRQISWWWMDWWCRHQRHDSFTSVLKNPVNTFDCGDRESRLSCPV